LKIPYNEVIGQKILITGQQMPFPDLLLQEKGSKGGDEDWSVSNKKKKKPQSHGDFFSDGPAREFCRLGKKLVTFHFQTDFFSHFHGS
jgi:hypothetical protein